MKSDFPWPKKGDKAFAFGEEAQIAVKGFFQGGFVAARHVSGYKLAADTLVDRFVKAAETDDEFERREKIDQLDWLLPPIGYLYRHCVELQLKRIIQFGELMDDIKHNPELKTEHNLGKLWHPVRKVLKAHWPTAGDVELNSVEAVMNEFNNVDKSGQAFRYLTGTNGKVHLRDDLPEAVSLKTLKLTMDGVLSFFDSCLDGLEEHWSWCREMEREMEREAYER